LNEHLADRAEPDTPTPATAATKPALHLTLVPQDAARLSRLPDFTRLRAGRPRASATRIVWHDAAELPLFRAGLALAEHRVGGRTHWRLERTVHPLGAAPEPVAEAATLVALAERLATAGEPPLPETLLPMVAFEGTMRTFPLVAGAGASQLKLLEGALRAVMREATVCRVAIEPSGPGAFALARTLAAPLRLGAARQSLAGEAMELARPGARGRRLDATLPPGLPVGDAFARIVAGLAADLLGEAPDAAEGIRVEPVHRMRVALRRLRSAMSLFQKAVSSPELDLLRAELKEVARVLGPARDWDVFLGGTGRAVAEAFADNRSVAKMIAAARRKREASYAELAAMVDSPAFRRLGLTLAQVATLRPWEHADAIPEPPEQDTPGHETPDHETPGHAASGGETMGRQATLLSTELEAYAARALRHRQKRIAGVGEDLSELPIAELHALRIQGKRLRYAAEFFAPLFPGRPARRYIRRLSAVQERLGRLNDASVAASLMAELGNADRFAAGIVHGFVAAHSENARIKAERSWRRFVRSEPFWKTVR